MTRPTRPTAAATGLLIVGVLALLVLAGQARPAQATHQPANKIAVAGSSLEILGAPIVEGASSETVTLLSASIKASQPTDLLFRVTLECALWTSLTTVGNDESEATSAVKVWVEYGGLVVPVAGDDSTEPGEVVFCNRTDHRTTSLFDDEDATIETFQRTRSANSFQWILLDAGAGSTAVPIDVKARLDVQVTGTGMAQAGIGKRVLVVEPERLANDITI